jgi:hypothetical protein
MRAAAAGYHEQASMTPIGDIRQYNRLQSRELLALSFPDLGGSTSISKEETAPGRGAAMEIAAQAGGPVMGSFVSSVLWAGLLDLDDIASGSAFRFRLDGNRDCEHGESGGKRHNERQR